MKNFLHRIGISRKFLLALTLPTLAMLYFAVSGIVQRQQVVSEMDRLHSLTAVAEQAGNLVHQLQRERGMTAGFLGSQARPSATNCEHNAPLRIPRRMLSSISSPRWTKVSSALT